MEKEMYLAAVNLALRIASTDHVFTNDAIVPVSLIACLSGNEVHLGLLHCVGAEPCKDCHAQLLHLHAVHKPLV